MPVLASMACRVVGADNITSLAARVFSVGETDDWMKVEVREPGHNTTFMVRVIRIRKDHGFIAFVIEGEILEADGRKWESLDAYFRMEAGHTLEGRCAIGAFPDDLHS